MAQDAVEEAATRDYPSLEHTLTYRMHLLHKLTDQESQRLYPLEAGLSLSDGRCLAAVGSFEPISVNRLAQFANLDKGQASRAAKFLVEQGLVARSTVEGDARAVELTLTPRGRKAWRKTMAFIHQRNDEIFSCLTPQEKRLMADLLDRLVAFNRPSAP
jgi:DNA-binding MarR family transcriptional regulator